MKPWQMIVVMGAALVVISTIAAEPDQCQGAWIRYGLSLPACPAGTMRQTAEVEVSGLRRGAEGYVYVTARAQYTTRDADDVRTEPVPEFQSLALALVDAKNAAGAQWTQAVATGKADAALTWEGLRAQLKGQGLKLKYLIGTTWSNQ